MSTSTPWGAAQTADRYQKGITFYTTSSHGGFKVCATLNVQIPEYMRDAGGWYEEDCDWSVVATIFPAAIAAYFARCEAEGHKWWGAASAQEKTAEDLAHARQTLRSWKPEAYERFYGVTLQPGESYIKDERAKNGGRLPWERAPC